MLADQLLIKIQEILKDKPDLYEIAENTLSNLLDDLKQKENTLGLKTISELENRNFFVDSYQRGYKWKPQQVKALLDDIDEFKAEKASDFYCLQPVVVKRKTLVEHKSDQYYWELIDGQQRMTTIFIILTYLNNDKFFHLRYETRKESTEFLNQLCLLTDNDDEIDLTTIDGHYFYEAFKTIKKWFEQKEIEHNFSREDWKSKLLNHTKVIWYAVRSNSYEDSRNQSIEIFTRLNQGKISLTDAELIKALFLQNVVKAYDSQAVAVQKQIEMANQWDLIEQSLQDADFWAFLSPHKNTNKYTRIELIFDLIAQDSQGDRLNVEQDHGTFLYYADIFKQYKSISDRENLRKLIELHWQKVLIGFQRLNEWYQDDRLYHLIGYLIGQKYKTIQDLWRAAEGSKRDLFEIRLKQLICSELSKIFRQKEDAKTLAFEAIDYMSSNPRTKIISVLTLFNIYRHEQHNTRFPFKKYYACKWDIEHIHAQQSPELSKEDQRYSWFEDQEKIISKVPDEYRQELIRQLNYCKEADELEYEFVKNQYLTSLYGIIGEASENVHTLDNLCLLPEAINRSIGNAPFFMKRRDIIESEQEWESKKSALSYFIPLASQQVFSKYFSEDVNQMLKWGSADRHDYKRALLKCFDHYGVKMKQTGMENK